MYAHNNITPSHYHENDPQRDQMYIYIERERGRKLGRNGAFGEILLLCWEHSTEVPTG